MIGRVSAAVIAGGLEVQFLEASSMSMTSMASSPCSGSITGVELDGAVEKRVAKIVPGVTKGRGGGGAGWAWHQTADQVALWCSSSTR